jgi:hypothetical protein
MKRAQIALTLGLILILSQPAGALSPPPPSLANPSFEDGFTTRGAPELEVAIGWDPAYLEGDHPWCRPPCHRPEFKPEMQEQYVTAGHHSQRWFSTFARQFGVIWQQVEVTPGHWYRFACDGYVISDPPGSHALFVGIQPWSGDIFDRRMVWGQELQVTGEWQRIAVTAQAWGHHITVAVGSNNAWPTRNNTIYVDNCTIDVVEFVDECPPCPDPGDPGTIDLIRQVIRDELEQRPPVRWPRGE